MFFRYISIFLIVGSAAVLSHAQVDASGEPLQMPGNPRAPLSRHIREMRSKQRAEQIKKDHDEMLERGDQALKLATSIEESLTTNGKLSSLDRDNLKELEKLVKKIRDELGGDSDDKDENELKKGPNNIKDVVEHLKRSTLGLVDELNKTTRFSISVVAIQSTNTVIRIARFLRLHK